MFILSDKMYTRGKKLVQVILPAISALYFGLATIWGFPEPDKVVGTIACVQLFLGVCLGISNKTYNAMGGSDVGKLMVSYDEAGKINYLLEVKGDPIDIQTKDQVTFKVEHVE